MEAEAGTPPAALPPKSEWKTYTLRVESIDTGFLDVRAPSPELAVAAARSYIDNGDDVDLVRWLDAWDGGSFAVPDQQPDPGANDPDIDYDAAATYRVAPEACAHGDKRDEGGVVTCGSCGATL
jgi:hypothetical protein